MTYRLLPFDSRPRWPRRNTILHFWRFKDIVDSVRVVISVIGSSGFLRMRPNFDRFNSFSSLVRVWYWLDVTCVESAIAFLNACARGLDASSLRWDAWGKPLKETGTWAQSGGENTINMSQTKSNEIRLTNLWNLFFFFTNCASKILLNSNQYLKRQD